MSESVPDELLVGGHLILPTLPSSVGCTPVFTGTIKDLLAMGFVEHDHDSVHDGFVYKYYRVVK